MMMITPVEIDGLEHAMYTESVRADAPWDPFRQAVFSLYEYKDKIRLRTYELAMGDIAKGVFDGMGAAPDRFPSLGSEELIATIDVELEVDDGTGFTGSTPYPYPTGVGDAVEMTSSITFDGRTLTTADRGYDANGEIVWGADAESVYEFEPTDPYAVSEEDEQGLVIVEYPSTHGGSVVEEGDTMRVHYSGYLEDGTLFDTSHSHEQPFEFPYPPGNRAIQGWGLGMAGFAEDARRKLIIPGELGYGDRGNPRAGIPGGATLIFDVHCVDLQSPPEEPPQPDTGSDGGDDQNAPD